MLVLWTFCINARVSLAFCFLALLGMALSTLPARAQVLTPQVQQAIDESNLRNNAGVIQEYSKKTLESEEKKPEAPKLDGTTEIDINPAQDKAIDDSIAHFTLNEVNVSGVSVFSDKEISDIIVSYVGKPANIAVLTEMKNKITDLYLQHGYLTSRAFLTSQTVTNGVINIQVVEGRVEDIQIEGLTHLRPRYITKRLHITKGNVFRVQDLEKDLQGLNQSNLVRLKANIAPGETFGTSDIILSAQETKPWSLSTFGDNQGRKNIGFYRSGVTIANNNLLGYGDHVSLSGLGSLSRWGREASQSVFGSYGVPIGVKGTEVGVSASAGHVDVGGPFSALSINGLSYTMGLYATGPLWQGKKTSLVWDTGLDSKRSLQFLGNVRFPDLGIPNTEVRTLHGGLTLRRFDRYGQTIIQNQVTQGLRALGGKTSFFKYNVDLTRVQALIKDAVLIARLSAQLSPDNMVSLEQFQMGGAQSVRGYSEGALMGDQGYFGSLELRVPAYFLPAKYERDVQMLGFFEAGTTGMTDQTQIDAHSGTPGNIRSVGVGIRAKVTRWISARLDAGFSFSDNMEEPSARIHFGLASTPF